MFGALIYDAKNGRDKNIGDYIQTLAAMQFTGPNVRFVTREHLDTYDGPTVRTILNSWYMHYPAQWPPSDRIDPLLVSVHITPSAATLMLSPEGTNFFKRFSPIGCRDNFTLHLLSDAGIKCYFSGCLTLTLGQSYAHDPVAGNVCFVDPYYDRPKGINLGQLLRCVRYFLKNIRSVRTIAKIANGLHGSATIKTILSTSVFYNSYKHVFSDELLKGARYITHMVDQTQFSSECDKFAYARRLLELYSRCEVVVTSRLHAALPCVGIGTPTVFVNNAKLEFGKGTSERFDGLLQLLNVADYHDTGLRLRKPFMCDDPITFSHVPQNRTDYRPLAESMIAQCKAFCKLPSAA